MAAWLFSDAILRGQSINVFNGGQMQRDFTYIDDAVEATLCVMHAERAALGLGEGEGKGEGEGGHRLFNVAAGQPVTLERFIDVLETASGRRAVRDYAPMQPGDVQDTAADISRLRAATGFSPRITLEEGAPIFVKWLKSWLEERGAA
jgi:UDP-glucuronate 4-epimerase